MPPSAASERSWPPHSGPRPRTSWPRSPRHSDSTLTAAWVERYGAWTAERLIARQKDRCIERIEEAAVAAAKEAERTEQRLRARIAQLEAGSPVDCVPAIAEAVEAERVAIRDLIESRRA